MRGAGAVAVGAALAATVGDLLLLWVANARRPEFAALPVPPAAALVTGLYLGVLALPLYGLGYRCVAEALAPADRRSARRVLLLGAYGGALGAVEHGLTALVLHGEVASGASAADPLVVIVRHGAFLLPLWVVVAGFVTAGSLVYARTVLRGGTAYPRWMAAANPLLLLAVLGACAAPSAWLRAFLLPAAPNVAHVAFFALAARLGSRAGPAAASR